MACTIILLQVNADILMQKKFIAVVDNVSTRCQVVAVACQLLVVLRLGVVIRIRMVSQHINVRELRQRHVQLAQDYMINGTPIVDVIRVQSHR